MAVWKFAARLLAFCAGLTAAASSYAAGAYPDHPVKIVAPFAAGGPSDLIGRLLADKLSTALGQQFYVEDHAGAGGNIGMTMVARAAPDGYTILVASSSFTVNPSLYANPPYDPFKDFAPVTLAVDSPNVLMVHPSMPVKTLADFIAYAKANPGKINFAHPGIGTSPHLSGELLKVIAGINIVGVAYRGAAPALTDVLGGQVDLMFISLVTGTAQVRAGNLRAYGVTSAVRQSSFPDLLAIGEIVPGFESEAWFGVFGPAKLPDEIVGKLNRAVVNALEDSRMREQLLREGANPAALTPAEFATFVREDIERWAPVVRSSGATPE